MHSMAQAHHSETLPAATEAAASRLLSGNSLVCIVPTAMSNSIWERFIGIAKNPAEECSKCQGYVVMPCFIYLHNIGHIKDSGKTKPGNA